MKRYIYNRRGYYTGASIEVGKFDTFPVNSTEIAPPSDKAKWRGDGWEMVVEIPVPPVRIPGEISLKDFKLALLDAGLLDTVTTHVQGLPVNVRKRVQIELENGGDITLQQAKKLLNGVIDDNVIEGLFISAG